jgi:hypothetical protein
VVEQPMRGPGVSVKPVLTAAVWGSAVLFVGTIVFAVLTEIQSDYLGALSEAKGGFDPTVFPPHSTVTWVMAMGAPVLTGALFALVVVARRIVRRPR